MHGTIKQVKITTAHSWCNGHSTSISVYGVWGDESGFKSPGGRLTHVYT